MTGIITQPRTLVQCVVGGGGAALPAPKFGNLTSNGKLRTQERSGYTQKGPQDPSSVSSQPARPSPNTRPLGPDQECGSLLSPQVSRKLGYTTSLTAKFFLLSNLSPAFGLSPFPLALHAEAKEDSWSPSPSQGALLCLEENDSVSSRPSLLQPESSPAPLTFPHMSCFFADLLVTLLTLLWL